MSNIESIDPNKEGHAADGSPKPPIGDSKPTPGDQERPLTEEEEMDEALDETFPASDPIAPSRIDGPDIDRSKVR